MVELILTGLGIIVAVAMLLWLRTLYVRVSPDEIVVLVGRGKRRVLRTSGFRKPITEDSHRIELKPIRVDIKTSDYISTHDFIDVLVDGNVTVKVDTRGGLSEEEWEYTTDGKKRGIAVAVENFVNEKDLESYVRDLTQDILEGNLREIIGKMNLETMVTDRKEFAEKVLENAVPDIESLGLEILTFNIQSFTDKSGTISKLGAENEENITKRAELVKIKAEEEKSKERSRADQSKHEAKVASDLAIAQKNQEYAIQSAELETQRAEAEAKAKASEELEKARQQKLIEEERAKVEQVRSETDIMIRENEAKANERIKIDNELYAEQKRAEAIKTQAEAEAEAIRLKGQAEAEAIREKQDAMSKYSEADMQLQILETQKEIARNLAKSYEKIGNITIYGGDGTDLMSGMQQTMSQFLNATGDTGFGLNSLFTGKIAHELENRNKQEESKETVEVISEDTTEE